jgi:DNA ligase D-like protein (predicted polymerase)
MLAPEHNMAKGEHESISVAGREVSISNPEKVLFPAAGYTKRDLVNYYLAVAEGALRGAGGRPNVLVRYPDGIEGEFFYQKRAPKARPAWIEVTTLHFPSGREAEEIVPRDAAALAFMANLACLELHPHAVRPEHPEQPDELRIDLDPVPGVELAQLREVAALTRSTLEDFGLVGFPKTSGARGIPVLVRIEPRFSFALVRRAALAFARAVARRAPALATSKWWKEERQGVFLDYNQNAKDRTTCSAYSVRPNPEARVSAPLDWSELATCEPGDFTLRSMPDRFARLGDRHAALDAHAYSLEPLLELSARQEREGLGDAPWPPHYRKQAGEPARVRPSAARKAPARDAPKSTGRRKSTRPLIEIGRARKKADALAGLERWKQRHPEAAAQLQAADILVDSMRGRFTTWTRVRVNLQNVPEALRPAQEPLDPDEVTGGWE